MRATPFRIDGRTKDEILIPPRLNEAKDSPKILYVGDVPVERSYHGSALLYRLLESHVSRLTIVESGNASSSARRLPHVSYSSLQLGNPRWLNTRFHSYVCAYSSLAATGAGEQLNGAVENVECDCVLTVAHGFGWLAAARLAETRQVPLHLIVHDDWPRVARVPRVFRPWLDRLFGEVYRQARSRLCVSPAMRDAYEQRYGGGAEVLYPIRSQACSDADETSAPRRTSNDTFTVAFAGSINSQGYVDALKTLHRVLTRIGGRLLIFGPVKEIDARNYGLDLPNITLRGLLDWPELIVRLREEADVLFVPMSFAKSDSTNMRLAFPSKLADYTAVGAPLLIYGPQYCSAVRWANENPGACEAVCVDDENILAGAVQRFVSSPNHRERLGKRALEVGRLYFSHEQVQKVFDEALAPSTVQTTLANAAVSCR